MSLDKADAVIDSLPFLTHTQNKTDDYPTARSLAPWEANPHGLVSLWDKCIGVDPSTVRRHIARMEADGFIKRQARYNKKFGGQETNIYHFDGLSKAATPHAKELITMREKQRNEDADRRSRKKPRLVVDNTSSPETEGVTK